MGHDTTPHVVSPAKACDVPMVFVGHGYGIEQIRQVMTRHLEAPT